MCLPRRKGFVGGAAGFLGGLLLRRQGVQIVPQGGGLPLQQCQRGILRQRGGVLCQRIGAALCVLRRLSVVRLMPS